MVLLKLVVSSDVDKNNISYGCSNEYQIIISSNLILVIWILFGFQLDPGRLFGGANQNCFFFFMTQEDDTYKKVTKFIKCDKSAFGLPLDKDVPGSIFSIYTWTFEHNVVSACRNASNNAKYFFLNESLSFKFSAICFFNIVFSSAYLCSAVTRLSRKRWAYVRFLSNLRRRLSATIDSLLHPLRAKFKSRVDNFNSSSSEIVGSSREIVGSTRDIVGSSREIVGSSPIFFGCSR